MTSQRIAQLRISPLHIQQGLFASLALMVTLVIGQQYQRWEDHHVPVHVSQHMAVAHVYSTVSALAATSKSQNFQSAESIAPITENAHIQKWVF